jgi:hypothetical protein
MTTRSVELPIPPADAWNRLKAAADSVGRIEEAQEGSRFLMVKARYGLNPVRLRVSVLTGPTDSTSILDIQGRGQDVWGVASRRVIDPLCAAVEVNGNDTPEEGWMADPSRRYPDRWWDGVQWTAWVRDKPGGTRSEDPPGSLPLPGVAEAQGDARDALPSDAIEQLRQLGELRDSGVITLEQFEAKREELLRRI